jgi:hypothetical protein
VTLLRLILPIAMCMPAIAAEGRCPWLNAATAGGVLGGPVRVTVTPGSCEFVRETNGHEIALRIEVGAVSAPHVTCGAHADPLKTIGNEALACSWEGKEGWISEQVTSRVRDQAFLVRVSTNDRSAAPKTLREKARNVAEQVAGFLF